MELERLRKSLVDAQADVENERRKHRNYIKTKGAEVNKLKQAVASAPSHDELARLKKENEEAQTIVQSEKYNAKKDGGCIEPETVYDGLIELVTKSYMERIDAAKKKGTAYEKKMEMDSQDEKKQMVYQFDDNGNWVDCSDLTAIAAYSKLTAGAPTLSVSFGGNTYTVELQKDGSIMQTNTQTGKQRRVQYIETVKNKADREELYNGMLDEDRNDILFGANSPVKLTNEQIDKWLHNTNFCTAPKYNISLAFSQLAQVFASLSTSDFHYVVDHGTQATHKRAKNFVSHNDGTYDFNCEIWIKPFALSQWISNAHYRGYTNARIVCHGASKEAIKKMRAHGIGFSMDFAGQQGQVYGPGLYFGLSDHAAVAYSIHSGYPTGSFVMGLVLTRDSNGWQHHSINTRNYQNHGHSSTSGPYGIRQISKEDINNYKTMNFSSPVPNTDNAMVLHDPALVLCLGLVHSFDKKGGYGWGA